MTDIQKELKELEDRQQTVRMHLESEIRTKIHDLIHLLRMRPEHLEFSEEVGSAFKELNRVRKRMGIREPAVTSDSGRKRFGRGAKMEFLRDWVAQRDGEFTHRDLCEAFAEMNHGQVTQRTFYLPLLKELIDEGIVDEKRIGEGVRPRLVFERAKRP